MICLQMRRDEFTHPTRAAAGTPAFVQQAGLQVAAPLDRLLGYRASYVCPAVA